MVEENLDDSCVFCDIIRGVENADKVMESEQFVAFYDTYPVNEGHTIIIPKYHVRYMEDLDNVSPFFEFVDRVHGVVKEKHNPDSTNVGINNGPEAGQTIPHLHCHIIPRYDGDMENPEGGVRGVIPSERTY